MNPQKDIPFSPKFKNATGDFDLFGWLNKAVDEEGVKLSIDLTARTYFYLALTGVLIFAAGAITWYSIGKTIKK